MSANTVWQRLLSFFPEVVKGNSGAAPAVDWPAGSVQSITLNAATVTPTFVPTVGGANLALVITQDGVGGRAVTWPAAVSWIGGTAPILLSGAGQTTLVYFYWDGTTYWGSLATGASPASLIPWTAVAAGTALAASLAKPNLAADSSGAQSTITLPTAAQMASGDGFEFTIKATGAMVSPVIVTAGAGATIELLNAPGTFGASTWLPIQGQGVVFKYDKATTTWKVRATSQGSAALGTSGSNPGWYGSATVFIDPQNVSTTAKDSNSGTIAGAALRTWVEALRRWALSSASLPSAVAITFLSSATDNSDPVVTAFLIEKGVAVSIQGTAPTLVVAGALAGVTAKNRAAGANHTLSATLPAGAAVGMQVINTTAGPRLNSRCYIKKALGGGVFELSQPFAAQAIPFGAPPTEVDGWANLDTINIVQQTAVNIASASSQTIDGVSAYLTIYNLQVFDPLGLGGSFFACAAGVNIVECAIQRFHSQTSSIVDFNAFVFTTFSNVAWLGGASFQSCVASILGGAAITGAWFMDGCYVAIDGDFATDVTWTFQDARADVGLFELGENIPVIGGKWNCVTLFYGSHVIYGSAVASAKNLQINADGRLEMASGTWAAGLTFPAAIAGGILLNGAATGQTHTNTSPDVVTSNVATTVANADAATQGTIRNFGGATMTKLN